MKNDLAAFLLFCLFNYRLHDSKNWPGPVQKNGPHLMSFVKKQRSFTKLIGSGKFFDVLMAFESRP